MVRSRKDWKAGDRWLHFLNCIEIWSATHQQSCPGAWQISKRYEHFSAQSRSYVALRDLTIKHPMQYWISPLLQPYSSRQPNYRAGTNESPCNYTNLVFLLSLCYHSELVFIDPRSPALIYQNSRWKVFYKKVPLYIKKRPFMWW